jgi:hypothetical protein
VLLSDSYGRGQALIFLLGIRFPRVCVQTVPPIVPLRLPLEFHISLIIILYDALNGDSGHLILGIPYEPVLLAAFSLLTFRRLLLIHGRLHF